MTFLPAEILARLVTLKVMNESLINHEVLEGLLFRGRTITKEELSTWSEHHGLRDLQDQFPSR